VQRLVGTLKAHGFIEQNPYNLRYRIGHRAFQVGQTYLARQALQNVAFDQLYDLAQRQGVCAYLGVMRGNAMVYLLSLLNGPVAVNTPPGSCAHLHSTAVGKMILAGLGDSDLEDIVSKLDMPRLTPNTITDREALLREVRDAAAKGYAICNTENIPDLYAIGAPVQDYTGQIVAAISFAMPQSNMRPGTSVRHADSLRDMAQDAAASISRKLGANLSLGRRAARPVLGAQAHAH
jgi:DNA-binding IclR family transcriptional regulator